MSMLTLAVSWLGCRPAPLAETTPLQGVMELEEIPIGFELSGRLTDLLVEAGDRVEAGALLAPRALCFTKKLV